MVCLAALVSAWVAASLWEALDVLEAVVPSMGLAAGALVSVAVAPLPLSTRRASVSSTDEAAAFAAIPAAFSFSSRSLLEMPCSLAIS
jgi:hypothetical protein